VLRKLAASITISLLSAALTITPAFAHGTLVSITPAQDSIQTVPPTKVVLTFDEKITQNGNGLTVTAPDGARVDIGKAKAADTRISVSLGPIKLNGHYVINYRIVSTDGHPVEASAGFEVLISALVSTVKPLVDATAETETRIDKREGLPSRDGEPEILVYVSVGIVTAGLAIYWLRRRRRTNPTTLPMR
jgi:methionine-rich copper-binding protein CopC